MKSKKGVFLLASLVFSQIMFCGFSIEMLVRVHDGYVPIGRLEVGDFVASSDLEGNCLEKRITHKRQCGRENCFRLVVGQEEIVASQSQKFFLADEDNWKLAKDLEVGDVFLRSDGDCVEVHEIVKIGQADLFEIAVEEFHNFFVSESELLVHNSATLVVEGTKVLTQIACCGIAAIAGLASSDSSDEPIFKEAEKTPEKSEAGKEESARETGAQAPGKPKEEDKFIPKKKWDGKKVKNPEGSGAGWPDKKDNVWVPTGENDLEKPHWDVQNPKTGKHTNVYPGGKIRGSDNRR